jgi:hypothetical protein
LEGPNGILDSIGFLETSAQADQATRITCDLVREQKLETALPKAPKITGGETVVRALPGRLRRRMQQSESSGLAARVERRRDAHGWAVCSNDRRP